MMHKLLILNIRYTFRFPIVTLPPSSVFQDSRITAAHLYPDVSKLLFHDLFEVGNIRFDPSVRLRYSTLVQMLVRLIGCLTQYWLATGGKFAEDLVTGRDLLVTWFVNAFSTVYEHSNGTFFE